MEIALAELLHYQLEPLGSSYEKRELESLPGPEKGIYIHAMSNAVIFGFEQDLELLSGNNATVGAF